MPFFSKPKSNEERVAEAKLTIKELKLKKKELGLLKREVANQAKAIRADYTETIRKKGSKFQGGGSLGRGIRAFQTISRDSARSDLAKRLAPLEKKQQQIEGAIADIDRQILKIESQIIKNS